jgi:peptide/nickel transport system ATP-binding protein
MQGEPMQPDVTGAPPLLEVDNLKVDFHTPTGIVHAVRGLSFTLGKERLGIVGESGSGKSMTGRAILDLIPHPGVVSADRLRFRGTDLMAMGRKERHKLRGRHISMVMQDPKFSLNPVETVGAQIAEAYRIHAKAGAREARERSLSMLEAVQIREPSRVYGLYPHEVSGGMGQRVMIAMMLIAEPDILIADEPTSALDVTVQLQILKILDELVSERGMGLIFISHDLHLVQSFCDRVIVMYGGKVMETLPAAELADLSARERRHPYTRGLLGCLPNLDRPQAKLATLSRDPAWLA